MRILDSVKGVNLQGAFFLSKELGVMLALRGGLFFFYYSKTLGEGLKSKLVAFSTLLL